MKKFLKVFCLIILIGIIGFEGFLFFRKDKKEMKKEEQSSSVQLPLLLRENPNADVKAVDVTTGYKANKLKFDESNIRKDENGYGYIESGYIQLDCLKDKKIEEKINKDIKDRYDSLEKEYEEAAVYSISSFSNILTVFYSGSNYDKYGNSTDFFRYYLSYNLVTGDYLNLSDVVNDYNGVRNELLKSAKEELSLAIGLICYGGPCENPDPDYSSIEDSLFRIMTAFNNGDFYLGVSLAENRLFFHFDNINYVDFEEDYDYSSSKKQCEEVGGNFYKDEEFGNDTCVFKNIESSFDVGVSLVDVADDLIIYDIFETEDSIFENDDAIVNIERKFIDENPVCGDKSLECSIFKIEGNTLFDVEGNGENIAEIYDKIIEEATYAKEKDKFNIYYVNVSSDYLGDYGYYGAQVWHFVLSENEFESIKVNLYKDKVSNRKGISEPFIYYVEPYSYLEKYLKNKDYFYYTLDGNKEIGCYDALNPDYDWSSVIPSSWLGGKYKTIDGLLKDAYWIRDEDYVNKDRLIFYDVEYTLKMKYKGETITLAKDYHEYDELIEQIIK